MQTFTKYFTLWSVVKILLKDLDGYEISKVIFKDHKL